MIKLLITFFCVLILIFNYNKKQLVSSSSLWVFAYYLIMVVYPLFRIQVNYINENLIDVSALIGIVLFFLGLVLGNKLTLKNTSNKRANKYYMTPNFRISWIFFCISFLVSLLSLFFWIGSDGIDSILSGVITSKQLILNRDRSMGIYGLAVHLMVPSILSMWIISKDKREKYFSIFALLVYIVETLLFGFTRLFLITILSIIAFFELRKYSQAKQLIYIPFGLLVAVATLVSLNFIRSLGLGRLGDLSNYINFDYIFESTDFGASYYWFNELLKYDSPFINPIVYLKPLFIFIPRTLWSTKPDPLSLQVLQYINPSLAATGYSTAGNSVLGEGYAVIGYFGIVLFPLLWGLVCGFLDHAYYKRLKAGVDKCLANIFYYIFAVFIVISGQRGDWSQYMPIVLWLYFLPLYIMVKVSLNKKLV